MTLWRSAALLVLGVGLACAQAHAADNTRLRVCADPDNPPFSSAEGKASGAYIEVADLLAEHMRVPADYTWWLTWYGRRAIRNTLLADECDAYIGLPADREFLGRRGLLTRPFLSIGYAVVLPDGARFDGLEALAGKRVAVQFNTPPQLILATRPGQVAVTFRHAEEALDALARGEADAAFIWGPVAGYRNRSQYGARFQVVPIAGEGLQWQVVIGVRKADAALRDRLDEAIVARDADIRRVAAAYGFPLDAPRPIDGPAPATPTGVSTAAADATSAAAGRATTTPGGNVAATRPTDVPTAAAAKPAPSGAPASLHNPYTGNVEVVAEGRSAFNNHCSHCHAPNAMSAEPTQDLRRLKRRYGDRMIETAYTTIAQGRPDKGMPAWLDLLHEDGIWRVITFLETVQRVP